MDRDTLSIDHIDPRWEEGRDYQLICGLECGENLLLCPLSYNATKQNKFVPYRVEAFAAPRQFGDIGEFLVNGKWTVCVFGGPEWDEEAKKIGCGSQQNRSWVTDPELHAEASLKGTQSPNSAISRGLTYATNGCHTPDKQSARIKGKRWWWHQKLKKHKRSIECPGEGWKEGRDPSINHTHSTGRRRYQHRITGEKRVLNCAPDDNWTLGWSN